ncbi:MAG: CoA-transferase [Armatimonadota bacterium]|nr:CoA-transferase [Armatimonadota bacterium]MDR7427011.1 CoA-transferase [Armatimonadota bacterium]MDR7463071.1 CoA-transferase [Armatimonadota bacterium]MDR7469346.1 CoA-transferase [Armatimonadota bacterium]MDR7475595.1 CoA-transferase [Armatimonadota bacterium]
MGTGTTTPSVRQIMVATAAREIRDGELVFVGMRLPLLAFAVAKTLHAPRAVGLFENGIVRDAPPLAPLVTMGDPPNVAGAVACTGLLDVMGLLQQGRVDLGLLGAAEVDRFGNLNTTWAGGLRLPGSGGACDIAVLSRRFIVLVTHERRRFPRRVAFLTSPGHGEGGDWRRRMGLRGGGPARVITTLGVLSAEEASGELVLTAVHPGVSVEQVRRETGWELRVAPAVAETPRPTAEELAVIRRFDPEGHWTGPEGAGGWESPHRGTPG